ncbi:MAG: lipocalin family protein [Treponema sp.]|jgi:hypothetical protein|nr:lipocalin family protein [Treponema sp.]
MKNKRLTKTAVLLIGIMLTFSMATCATAQQSADQQSAQQQAAEQQPDPSQHPPAPQPASANPAQPYTLVGSWYTTITYTDGDGPDTRIYTFNSDGTGTYESREIRRNTPSSFRKGSMSAFRWTVSGNRLTRTWLYEDRDPTQSDTYSISGNTLTFTLSGGGTQQYTRAQPQQALTTNQPLPIGTWNRIVNGVTYNTYTFNSNGTGTSTDRYNNTVTTSNLTWTIHEDWLRMDVNTGNNRSPITAWFRHYSISGNTLSLGGEFRNDEYTRQ